MIAKYPGICSFCKQPIAVGVDTYDTETKKAFHQDCFANQPPQPDAFRVAERLGFVPYTDEAIRAAIRAWQIQQDWFLRPLLNADRSDSAGRPATPPRPRSIANLFDDDRETA